MVSRSVADNLADEGSHSTRRSTPPACARTRYTVRTDHDTSFAIAAIEAPFATNMMIRFRSAGVNLRFGPEFEFPTTTSNTLREALNTLASCNDH